MALFEEQCFVIWIKILSCNFLRVFVMSQQLLWQWYSAAKRPFKTQTQFIKNNLKSNLMTSYFFFNFQKPHQILVSYVIWEKLSSRTWVIYKRVVESWKKFHFIIFKNFLYKCEINYRYFCTRKIRCQKFLDSFTHILNLLLWMPIFSGD